MALLVSILIAAFGVVLALVSNSTFQAVGVLLLIFGTAALYVWLVCRRAQAMRAKVSSR